MGPFALHQPFPKATQHRSLHLPSRPTAAYVSYAATMAVLQFLQATLFAQSAHALDEAPEDAAPGAPGGSDAWGRGGYAVLFSLNGTLSLAVQTAVQMFAASSRMTTRAQFWMLAGYSVFVAVVTAGCGLAARQRAGQWRLTHSGEGRGGTGGAGRGSYAVLDENSGGDIPMRIADDADDR